MKKAVIASGGKQYLVAEGETVEVELINSDQASVSFEPLLVIDDSKTTVGTPTVSGVAVTAEVVESDVAGPKVTAIRYKPKKRVRKIRGHRQHHTQLRITKIG